MLLTLNLEKTWNLIYSQIVKTTPFTPKDPIWVFGNFFGCVCVLFFFLKTTKSVDTFLQSLIVLPQKNQTNFPTSSVGFWSIIPFLSFSWDQCNLPTIYGVYTQFHFGVSSSDPVPFSSSSLHKYKPRSYLVWWNNIDSSRRQKSAYIPHHKMFNNLLYDSKDGYRRRGRFIVLHVYPYKTRKLA